MGVGVSIPITLVSALVSFPVSFHLLPYLASFGILAPVVAFALVPILANLFVWRAYFSHSSRTTQASLVATGLVLSLAIAVLFSVALFFWMLNDF